VNPDAGPLTDKRIAMAWTEQCKVAFHANATAKLGKFKNKNRKLAGVLRELSKESGIPWRTLEGWWREQTSRYPITRENTCDKKMVDPGMMCKRCGKQPVEICHGKPRTENSKYYGLCRGCRDNQMHIGAIDRTASSENGIMTVCPHCEKVHYVYNNTKLNRKRG
jgi:hypothetical protein